MGTPWDLLHQGFRSELRSSVCDCVYSIIAWNNHLLDRFPSPDLLIDYLTSHDGDLDEKDALLRVFVAWSQKRRDLPRAAVCVLWLGLRPGLDHRYRSWLRREPGPPGELALLFAGHFVEAVRRIDLHEATRVAATLVCNTARDASTAWIAERKACAAVRTEHSAVTHLEEAGTPDRLAAGQLLGRLEPSDAQLLVRTRVLGESVRDVATSLGRSPSWVQERVTKAIELLREDPAPTKRTRERG
jgi:hypothetical protein